MTNGYNFYSSPIDQQLNRQWIMAMPKGHQAVLQGKTTYLRISYRWTTANVSIQHPPSYRYCLIVSHHTIGKP